MLRTVVVTLLVLAAPASAQRQYVHNTVRVEAGGRTGFGFIVGLQGANVLIATAWHTLDGVDGDPSICFAHRPTDCARGQIVHVADAIGALPALDLAIVSAAYPAGLAWRPDAQATKQRGEDVWFIGRSREWYLPDHPGRITSDVFERRLLEYRGLDVAEGVSGAPIVTRSGIVAMHVESEGETARGIAIDAIRERVVEHVRAHWALVPRPQCDERRAQRAALEGRDVAVFFDPARPAAALDAAALLLCVGARVMLQPAAEWTGVGITYPRGELLSARAIQSTLAPLGRLDTALGSTFEVRVR